MNTKLCTSLTLGLCLLCVPVIGNGWQSGRLKNQRSSSRPSSDDSTLPGPYVPMPTLIRPGDRPERAANPDSGGDALSTPGAETGNGRITWERSLHSAIKAASAGNKLIVVDVYADWCGWCKRMDRAVYSNPRVAALSRDAVFLRLNTEDRGEGQRFARQNRVNGLPTTVILNQKGSVVNIVKGYIGSPDQFITMVERAKDRA